MTESRQLRLVILSVLSGAAMAVPATGLGAAATPTDPTNTIVITNVNPTTGNPITITPTTTLIDGVVNNSQSNSNNNTATQNNSTVVGNPVQGGTVALGSNKLAATVGANSVNNGIDLSLLNTFANASQGINSAQSYLGVSLDGSTVYNFSATNSNALIYTNLNGIGNSASSVTSNTVSASGTINSASNVFTGTVGTNYTPPTVAQPGITQSTTRDASSNVVTTLSNAVLGGITATNTQLADNVGYGAAGANASNTGAKILIEDLGTNNLTVGQRSVGNTVSSNLEANSETTSITPTLGANSLSSTVELSNSQANVASLGVVNTRLPTEKASTTGATIGIDLRDSAGSASNTITATAPVSLQSNAITASVVGNSAVGGADANGNATAGNLIDIEGNVNAASTASGAVTINTPGVGNSTVSATIGLANGQISQGTNLSSTDSGTINLSVDQVTGATVSGLNNQLSASTKGNDAYNRIQVGAATNVRGSVAESNNQTVDLSAPSANATSTQSLTATTSGTIGVQAGRLASGDLSNGTLNLSNNTSNASASGNSAIDVVVLNANNVNAPQSATVPLASGTLSNSSGAKITANANTVIANNQELVTNGTATTAIITATNTANTGVQLLDTETTVAAPSGTGSVSRSTSAIGLTGSTVNFQGNQTQSQASVNTSTSDFAFTGNTGSSAAVDNSQIAGVGVVSAVTNGNANASVTGLEAFNSTINVNNNLNSASANGNVATNVLSQTTGAFNYNNPSATTPAANVPQSAGGHTVNTDAHGNNTLGNSGALSSELSNQVSSASLKATLSGNFGLISLAPITALDANNNPVDDAHGSQSAGQVNGTSLVVTNNSDVASSTANSVTNTLTLGSAGSLIQTLLPAATANDHSIDHQSAALLENAQTSEGATQVTTINSTNAGVQLTAEDSATKSALANSTINVANNTIAGTSIGNQANNTESVNANTINGQLLSMPQVYWGASVSSAPAGATMITLGGAGANHDEQTPLALINSQNDTTTTRTTTINSSNIEITVGVNPNSSNAATGVGQTISSNAFTLDSNSISGNSRNNLATNQLNVSATSNNSGGTETNNQNSTAASTVTVTGSVEFLSDGDLTKNTASASGNTITVTNDAVSGRNFGNVANNSITLSGTSLNSTRTAGAAFLPNITTANSTQVATTLVGVDWGLVNQQVNTGDTASTVNAGLVGVDLSGGNSTLAAGWTTGSINVSNNSVLAVTRSNLAGNSLTASATSSDQTIKDVVSNQAGSFAATSQNVTGALTATIGLANVGQSGTGFLTSPIVVSNNTAGADVGVNDVTNTLSFANSNGDSAFVVNAQNGGNANVTATASVNVLGADLSTKGIPQLKDTTALVTQNNVFAQGIVNQANNSITGTNAANNSAKLLNTQTSNSVVSSTLGVVGTSSIVGFENLSVQGSSGSANVGLTVNNNTESAVAGANNATNSLVKATDSNSTGPTSVFNIQTQGSSAGSVNAVAQSLNIGVVPGSANSATVGNTLIDNHTSISVAGNAVKANGFGNASVNTLTQTQDSTSVSGDTLTVSNSQLSNAQVGAAATDINVGVRFGGTNQDSYANTSVLNNTVAATATANSASDTLTLTAGNSLGSRAANTPTSVAVSSAQNSSSTVYAELVATQLGIAFTGTSASGSASTTANVTDVVSGNTLNALANGNTVSNNLIASAGNVLNDNVALSVATNQNNTGGVSATISSVKLGVTAGVNNQDLTALNQVGATVNNNTLLAQAVGNSSTNIIQTSLPVGSSLSSASVSNLQTNSGAIAATTTGVVLGFSSTNGSVPTAALSSLPITVSGNSITTQAIGNSATNVFLKK